MTYDEAKELLARYSDFQESIVLGYFSSNLLRDFELLFSRAWDLDQLIVADNLNNKALVRFESCRSIKMVNGVDLDIGPEANWGFNEVSHMEVEPADSGFLRFSARWSGERRIDVECRSVRVLIGFQVGNLVRDFFPLEGVTDQ